MRKPERLLLGPGCRSAVSSVCNNPAVPHPAQMAGFTTLAYCADFTTDSGTNNVLLGAARNQNWSGMSWMDCTTGNNGNTAGKQWLMEQGGQTLLPCSTVSVGADPATSAQALTLTVHPSDGTSFPAVAGIGTSHYNCVDSQYTCYMTFPTGNAYAEISWRINVNSYNGPDGTACGGSPCLERFDFWSGGAQKDACLEIDYIEYFAGSTTSLFLTGASPVNWCGGSQSGQAASISFTQDSNYHNDGALTTTNNTASPIVVSVCTYHDGAASQKIQNSSTPGCVRYSEPNAPSYQMQSLLLANAAAGNGAVASNVPIYIAWIRVWVNSSCYDPTQNPRTATNTCTRAAPYQTAP